MDDAASVLGYLKSSAFQEAAAGAVRFQPQPFITISRQAGAGGSSLAEAILQEMKGRGGFLFDGWRVLDRDLCEILAKDPELTVFLDALARERFRGQLEDYLAQMIARETPQLVVLKRIFKTIRAAASVGKVIVVGRGGCCVTRGLPLGIHIRLVAPRPERLEAIMRRYGLERRKADNELEDEDLSRARLVRTCFNRDIADPLLYDATWNTAAVPMASIAAHVAEMVREKALSVRGEALRTSGRPSR